MKTPLYKKPNLFAYALTRFVAFFVAVFCFKRRVLRNELRGVKGPFVVIANHQAALDFVNLIGVVRRRMTFVISNSFYSTLPVRPVMDAIGVIPKQQFQTTVSDMKRMKAVTDNGGGLVIYPAGLMCEDGLSTPIPGATYKFLKWLGADVYVTRTTGSYFAMPKWSKGFRPGRTLLDIYKLFDKDTLAGTDLETVRAKVDEALLFDAYREQETLKAMYADCDNLEGLHHVLYMCPHCGKEFTIRVRDKKTLYCTDCGFEQTSDRFALLHNLKGIGREYRYVSDWSRLIFERLKEDIRNAPDFSLSSHAVIRTIDLAKHKFTDAGEGIVTLTKQGFSLQGTLYGEPMDLLIPIDRLPTLPFGPGKHFEIQKGKTIYRCLPDDPRLVMKYINAVKAFYALSDSGSAG